MSMLWKKLLRDLDGEVADALSLDRVTTNRTADKITVRLFSNRFLSENDRTDVERALQKGFPRASVDVRINYPALREAALSDIDTAMKQVCILLKREKPGALPYLMGSGTQWKLSDGRLTVGVTDAMGLGYMEKNGIADRLSELLAELFGINVKVTVEMRGDTEKRIAEIAQRRREEEERLAKAAVPAEKKVEEKVEEKDSKIILGKEITEEPAPISDITEDGGKVVAKGEILKVDSRDFKDGSGKIVNFSLADASGAVQCKAFVGGKRMADNPALLAKTVETAMKGFVEGATVIVRGEYVFDEYMKDMVLAVRDAEKSKKEVRTDNAVEKRVELHLHTNMSTMDGMASVESLIKRAASWGHKAIAVTDHGVVQAFPEAFAAAKKNGIKLIPGCEGYLIDDYAEIVKNADGRALKDACFVVLDFETTGLNANTDSVIEIGAVRIENGVEVGEFSQLINPLRPIPEKVTEITGINDMTVRDMPSMDQVIGKLRDFCEGAVICAHNADFDSRFLERALRDAGYTDKYPVLDTLALSRCLLPDQKSHKLGNLCKYYGVSLKDAHRAVHDARATASCMLKMFDEKPEIETLSQLNEAFSGDGGNSYHIILLAASQKGITNLYRLVSEGHLNHFHRTPRIPRHLIEQYREGLIVGSACEAGELFRAMVAGASRERLRRIASFYDYLEVQPIGNNMFMVRNGTAPDEEALREYNRRIVRLGEDMGKPVVATGDVHFMEPEDAIFRAIVMTVKGFEDADEQAPLYFRTTDDMLEEFSYLGPDKAMEIVVKNPNAIADQIAEGMSVFIKHPEGKETFQPFWEDAEDDIRTLTKNKATAIYGDPLPDIVQARIDKELKSIIGYGFSTLYDIAVKLVNKSVSDGYIVGSRGSVGSSLVAFMTGITEVNALPPHYVCPACRHSEFDVPKEYTCGIDLPEKSCPVCGANMNRDGFNIPFEVFLGFKGDKVPDIDLNFSGEYQNRAQNYVKELFGAENVFRAGTIGAVKDNIAYGYVLKYLELHGKTASPAEKERLARGIIGVKNTTGQHPAGMVVLPKNYEIYQFTPIQHPADDQNSDTITTHFAFKSMHDVLVKLDILGHDDPTMLRKLQDLTGIAPQKVPLNDPEIFKTILTLFTTPKALGVTKEQIGSETGTLGIPEFGTPFVRQMLVETQPRTMEELIRISGLSHGTDVWIGNVQEIIKAGLANLKQCICTRDDIMNQLIDMGCESKMAFTIMESVRKGKGLKPEMEEAMHGCNTPEWFMTCCRKIGYMFPKAHAVAYVTMALRIAYFKVYYPKEYYACYLKRNIEKVDASRMAAPLPVLKARIDEIRHMEKKERESKSGEEDILEILIEMLSRGIDLLPISLYESDAENFLVKENGVLPPFSSLPGIGLNAARSFVAIRDEGKFISRDDMLRRKVTHSMIDMLDSVGALEGIPMTSQVSLFEMA